MTSKTEARDAIFSHLDVFLEGGDTPSADLPWIGTGADLAFADAALATGAYVERRRIIDQMKLQHRYISVEKQEDETQIEFALRLVRADFLNQWINSLEKG